MFDETTPATETPDTTPESAPVEIELDELSVPEPDPEVEVPEAAPTPAPAAYVPLTHDVAELRSDSFKNQAARHNRAFPELVRALDTLIAEQVGRGGLSAVLRCDVDAKLCERLKAHFEQQGFRVTYVSVDAFPERDGYIKVMWS